jgi:hypothetical protein
LDKRLVEGTLVTTLHFNFNSNLSPDKFLWTYYYRGQVASTCSEGTCVGCNIIFQQLRCIDDVSIKRFL